MNLQESILIAIGVVVLAIGAAMAFAKVRGWLAATSIGALWLLAMALYTAYKYSGFYGSAGGLTQGSLGPVVTTVLGFAIFAAGLGIFIYIYRRGRGGAR